ncbi:MAG: hypothetical protein ABF289_05275 [Clostridiales bacterium]
MRKKYLKAGIGIAVGSMLLITSTVISLANGPSAYETLKESVKNSNDYNNVTLESKVSLVDNNETVVNLDMDIKADHSSEKASGTLNLKVEDIDKEIKLYLNEKNVVVKPEDQDEYFKFTNSENYKNHSKMNEDREITPQMEELYEKVLDSFVGDLKKQVVEKDIGNGEKEISIELNDKQIPEIVNAIVAAKSSDNDKLLDDGSKNHDEYIKEIFGFSKEDIEITKLTDDVKVKNIYFKSLVDKNNMIKSLEVGLDINGKDEKGKVHTQSLKATVKFSNINKTVVDEIDLTGKKVKEIESEKCKSY